LMMRSSSLKEHCVKCKLNCKPKKLLQEVLILGLSGVFPNITTGLHILIGLATSGA
jgi:hypothetical protein